MKLLVPENIFTKLLLLNFPEGFKSQFSFVPAAAISSLLKKDKDLVGLIPSMDLIRNTDFFVNHTSGISFDGLLSNSYLYYPKEQKKVTDLYLTGDVSSLEVILSKIFFKEIYNADIEPHILTPKDLPMDKNLMVTGDRNYEENLYQQGLSFADEIVEMLNLPFINYIFASLDEGVLSEFSANIKGIGEKIYQTVESGAFGETLDPSAKAYIQDNISSVIFDFDEQDIEGLNQLIRLPYFYGIIDEMFEIKFI